MCKRVKEPLGRKTGLADRKDYQRKADSDPGVLLLVIQLMQFEQLLSMLAVVSQMPGAQLENVKKEKKKERKGGGRGIC